MTGIRARLAVGVARVLITLPPRRLARAVAFLHRGARPASAELTQRARDTVCATSARCTGQGCLPRSVAVVVYCRLHGRAPDWCTGFALDPFTAHAWVEVDGAPVGEPPKVAEYIISQAVRLRSPAAA
ncbi:hypothetical protein UO65_3799 [Actinokineospora spheciospongiae]|uniref:Microcin J25-processing protein McjB C-terminal domain-containing protein n=1 Tax=Actinokineospora spheciospongiae TaxID=909613 RepID=W7J402_9PSEU|nr:lasso peptide biosynthesis B2 protein [Actinokineospora spheciospongiae]EWC60869.1 hypothetical protein UO65_3799 [Actinokineospora spheciospongiae]PWW60397.1 transglutaminase superfamily protein [Actinokineospora spheciospongiae]